MAETIPLTPKQQRIYDFICHRIEERGYPPTIRDIGTAFDIRSPNGVMCHLKALEKKGFIIRDGQAGSCHSADTPPRAAARAAVQGSGRRRFADPGRAAGRAARPA